jgi:hypothetical protein
MDSLEVSAWIPLLIATLVKKKSIRFAYRESLRVVSKKPKGLGTYCLVAFVFHGGMVIYQKVQTCVSNVYSTLEKAFISLTCTGIALYYLSLFCSTSLERQSLHRHTGPFAPGVSFTDTSTY